MMCKCGHAKSEHFQWNGSCLAFVSFDKVVDFCFCVKYEEDV